MCCYGLISYFGSAPDDVPEHQQVKQYLQEIQVLRSNKISLGLKQIQANANNVKLNNISAMEICTNRSTLLQGTARMKP